MTDDAPTTKITEGRHCKGGQNVFPSRITKRPPPPGVYLACIDKIPEVDSINYCPHCGGARPTGPGGPARGSRGRHMCALCGNPNMHEYIDDFRRLTAGLTYRPKAVFPSEMFLFYAKARAAGADRVVESGICFGGSTSYLARLFPGAVTSIGLNIAGALGLKVDLIRGDSTLLMPGVVDRFEGGSVAILIDGPKGQTALTLKDRMLRKENVRFVAVHDLAFEPGDHVIDSHAPDFREDFGVLDTHVGEALKKHPRGPGLSIFTRD